MTRGSEMGRTARRRRLELGVSQSRVAEAIGVSPLQVGRWERGEDVPEPGQVRALADVLDLGSDAAEIWLAAAEAHVLSVEILEDPLAPPLTIVETVPDPDPWSTPPENRVAPPQLDRAALIGRGSRESGSRRTPPGKRSNGNDPTSTTAVVPITIGVPDASLERAFERRVRRDERRVRRETIASDREQRTKTTTASRLRMAEEAEAARRAPLPAPRPRPTREPAPAPAGAANTGVVFPVPDTKKGSERVTYHGTGEATAGRDRLTYALRLAGTIAAMAVAAGLLWWAIGALGDGFGAIMDLLRGGDQPLPASEVAGLGLLG